MSGSGNGMMPVTATAPGPAPAPQLLREEDIRTDYEPFKVVVVLELWQRYAEVGFSERRIQRSKNAISSSCASDKERKDWI